MVRKLLLALALCLLPTLASAACSGSFSAAYFCGTGASAGAPGPQPLSSLPGLLPLPSGDIFMGNGSGKAAAVAPVSAGDCTWVVSNTGTFTQTCLKTNGVAFGSLATQSSVTSAQLPAPFTNGAARGNTSSFATYSGTTPTALHIATFDASGNIQDGGASTGTVTEQKNVASTGLTQGGNCDNTSTNASSACTFAVSLSLITQSLGSNVAITTNVYADGPSVAQGASGVWFASGTVTLTDSTSSSLFACKLWDGTNVIASTAGVSQGANAISMSLSGISSNNPPGNIRISCLDTTTGNHGLIVANSTGAGKDSTVSAVRIQ